jgi:hypothetical protein
MQNVVEVVLNIAPNGPETPADILDRIQAHIRSKRNVALDRVEFELCRQEDGETFDDFYIRLKQCADSAELCATCIDQRMATRIMSGIRDQEVRKRLLAVPDHAARHHGVPTGRDSGQHR